MTSPVTGQIDLVGQPAAPTITWGSRCATTGPCAVAQELQQEPAERGGATDKAATEGVTEPPEGVFPII
ncbi:hypothetical protein [Streptomyces sp. NPDC085529]|uniref:hypothetical protein n=1 Tax=Streptomyces sp. NPDC085529 TaxID=3365729 RepID=UPI0037D5D22E